MFADTTQRVALAIEEESFVSCSLEITETDFSFDFIESTSFHVADGHHSLIEVRIL